MRWLRWAAGRVALGFVTVLGVAALVFLVSRAVPGDLVSTLLGPLATAEQREVLTARLGLDEPLPVQFGLWLSGLAVGDLGTSAATGVPIMQEFALRLPVTATIAAMSIVVAAVTGIPLGIAQALHARRAGVGVGGRLVSGLAISVPEFVLGSFVVFVFSSLRLGVSIGTFTPVTVDFLGGLASSLLPALVLAVFMAGATARTTRDAVLDVLVEPHVLAAVARGERPATIVRRHVLRNASIPVLTLLATLTAYLLGGAIIVESMFNVPGMGSYLMSALVRRDYLIIQAGVTLAAIVFVAVSVVLELASSIIDPRVARIGRPA